MWTPEGMNGLWTWNDTGNWLQTASEGGLQYVLVKAADIQDAQKRYEKQFTPELVQRVHDQGLGCMAWTYIYLDNPEVEVEQAVEAVRKGADGLMLDIEYEAIGKLQQAETFITGIRRALPDTFIGYAPDLRIGFGNGWPNGGFDPDIEPFPWVYFNTLDGVFPQLYWVDFGQSPLKTLELANAWARGCQSRGWPVPKIYPVIPCTAPNSEVSQFVGEAVLQGFAGASIWRNDYGNWKGCIDVLKGVQWPMETPINPVPAPDMIQTLLTYIGEMGNTDGSVIKALDAELAKKTPSKVEIRNIRNRLVTLSHEARGD